MSLRYVDVASGRELDVVTLTAGKLAFMTGAAEPRFRNHMERYGHTPEAVYNLMSGWSNGYAQLVEDATGETRSTYGTAVLATALVREKAAEFLGQDPRPEPPAPRSKPTPPPVIPVLADLPAPPPEEPSPADWLRSLSPEDVARYAGGQSHALAEALLRAFNPDQERDEKGRFAPGDGDDDTAGGGDQESTKLTPDDFIRPGEGDTWSMSDGAAKRLADSWDVSEADLDAWIAEESSSVREHYKDKSFDEKREGMARSQIAGWRGGSGGPEAVAAITGVADRLGAQYKLAESEQVSQDYIGERPAVQRAMESYGETMYAQTQSWFTEREITHVDVERVTFRGEAKDNERPFTSWSAAGSAGYYDERTGSTTRRETVPVERVMSIPPTGYGTLAEMEVVLLPPLPSTRSRRLAVGAQAGMVVWSRDGGVTGHAMVRTADGRYVDVAGSASLDEMLGAGWQISDVSDVESAESLGWDPPVVDEQVRALAATIAAAAGRHVEGRTLVDVGKQVYAERARRADHPGLAMTLRARAALLAAGLRELPPVRALLRAFNADQPRDEKGRFAPGDGDDDEDVPWYEVGVAEGGDPGRLRDGNTVGEATRTILSPDQRTVRHDGMGIEPGFQGQGFATRYNAHVEESYRAHGIERIELNANIDVGGYAWARAGYDFRDSTARETALSHVFVAFNAGNYSQTVRDEVSRAMSNPDVSPVELAMIGHTPGATTWPGKEMMLGSSWDAVKHLGPSGGFSQPELEE